MVQILEVPDTCAFDTLRGPSGGTALSGNVERVSTCKSSYIPIKGPAFVLSEYVFGDPDHTPTLAHTHQDK